MKRSPNFYILVICSFLCALCQAALCSKKQVCFPALFKAYWIWLGSTVDMCVRTLAPDGGSDPGEASRASRRPEGPGTPHTCLREGKSRCCSMLWRLTHSACCWTIASWAAIKKYINKKQNKQKKTVVLRWTILIWFRQKHWFGFILQCSTVISSAVKWFSKCWTSGQFQRIWKPT